MNELKGNLDEIIGNEIIDESFTKTGSVRIYWGTAPTGRPHIAYFLPILKVGDFLRSGASVTILLANLHAYLDNMKAPWGLLDKRTEYYELLIRGMLDALHVPSEQLRFVRGTDYQLTEAYTRCVWRIIADSSLRDAAKAGCDVVKQTGDPLMSGIVYPLLQALDEEFLDVDAQLGGVDQRKIFVFAEKHLPAIGMAKRAHLMNPMLPGLAGGKMSASDAQSKVDLLDAERDVRNKMSQADPTGLLAFARYVVHPVRALVGASVLDAYATGADLEAAVISGDFSADILKQTVSDAVVRLTSGLRNAFLDKEALINAAYPLRVDGISDNIDDVEELRLLSTMDAFPEQLIVLRNEFPHLTFDVDAFPLIRDVPTVLWSCRVTGEPHVGYLLPIRSLVRLSQGGWRVVILVEDIAGHLIASHELNRCPWNLIDARSALYSTVLRSAFCVLGGDPSRLTVIRGSDHQLSPVFAMLLYHAMSKVTVSECTTALTALTGQAPSESPLLSAVLYPCVRAIDQLFLRPTVRLHLPADAVALRTFDSCLADRLGHHCKIPVYVLHSSLPALDASGRRMGCPRIAALTAPRDMSSLSLLDAPDSVDKKLKKCFFDPQRLDDDPCLHLLTELLWNAGEGLLVRRTAENGGDVLFRSLEELRRQLRADEMHPGDVKVAVSNILQSRVLVPLQAAVDRDLFASAFPIPSKPCKIGRKEINPNSLDITVAAVDRVAFERGRFFVRLIVGGRPVNIERKNLSPMLVTPGCFVLAVGTRGCGPVGLLATQQCQQGDMQHVLIILKPKSYLPGVTFSRYDPICPSLKETSTSVVAGHIATGCLIVGGHLHWHKGGAVCADVELLHSVPDHSRVVLLQ